MSDLNDRLEKTTAKLTRVKGRPFEISARLPEIQRELSDVRKELASPALAGDVTSPGRIADRILLQARQSKLLRETGMPNQEQLSQSVREDLVQAQHELLERQVENARAALGTLQAIADQRLASEAERVGLLAERMPEGIPEDDEAAQALAAEVQTLAKEFENVVQNLQQVKVAQEDVMSKLERLIGRYERVKEELQVGFGESGMAQILLDMQRQFPDQRTYVLGLSTRVVPLEETRLGSLQVRRKRRNQSEVERQFAENPSEAVARLVTTRRELLANLRILVTARAPSPSCTLRSTSASRRPESRSPSGKWIFT